MADADSFVQKMKARVRARQPLLERVGMTTDKENLFEKSQSNHVSSKIEKTDSSLSVPLQSRNKSTNLDAVLSPERKSSSSLKTSDSSSISRISQNSCSLSPQKTSFSSNSSTRSSRFHQLSQRSKEMQQWEDDYTYHSIIGSKKVETKMGTKSIISSPSKLHENVDSCQKFSPLKSPSKAYYYGQSPTSNNTIGNVANANKINAFSPRHSPSKILTEKHFYYSSSKTIPSNCMQTQSDSVKNNQLSKKSQCPHSKNQTGNTPTRSLAWDKELINNLEQRRRDESPSKVNDLKSHFEDQIRSASPDRQILNRSPSPIHKFYQSPNKQFATRSPSPVKKFIQSPSKQMAPRATSPVKEFQPRSTSPTKFSSAFTGNSEFRRGGEFQSSLRNFNRSKPSLDIVKGEAPMPLTTPVVRDNVRLSVKQRAAAFTSVMGPQSPTKDPAELSVRDRKGLFERRKSEALVPKAPFGQPVAAKVLQSHPESTVHKIPPKMHQRTQHHNTAKPKVPSSFEEQRKMFENVEDDWQVNEISAQVAAQRKQEMEVLLNRFKKPKTQQMTSAVAPVVRQEIESESEYPESDDDSSSVSSDQTSGPTKPPRTFEASPTFLPPLPPGTTPHSPFRRMNSTELGETNSPSPTKEYVPKIKPGCLFPSLSDIESNAESAESQDEDETRNSSFAESVLTSASIDSLGKHIVRIAQPQGGAASLSTIREGGEWSRFTTTAPAVESCDTTEPFMSESVEEAIGAIDDALDEAFSDDQGPTPPKRSRPDYHSDNIFKTPKISKSSSDDDSGESSLAHSISMYRKQKPQEVTYTPVRQVVRKADLSCLGGIDSPVSPSVSISHRIKDLQAEAEMQGKVIFQASSAISVVAQRAEQYATIQHVEAEKLLLVATQKRQAALNEVQRLKTEGAMGKRTFMGDDEDSCRGSISISNIALPLKADFLNKSVNGSETNAHHILVLVKHRDQVITSQLQTAPAAIVEGAITFPNLMALHNLSADFNISLEVYCFRLQSAPSNFKKEQSRMRLTPLKRLQKESKSAASSPALQSPGGPSAVRSSSFALIGFAHLNIHTLTRNAWTLEKVPFNSPLDGHLLMRVSVSMEGGVAEKNFLTMFEDVGGFGAWNRRWCSLNGPYLKYWNYPDDENKKECMGYLDLRMCTTRKVELVSRDVCARQFTFQLTLTRPARKGDKTDLVNEVKNNIVVSRVLLSADSKEERILWCNKLNRSLANIRAWDPDALRPEDFHV